MSHLSLPALIFDESISAGNLKESQQALALHDYSNITSLTILTGKKMFDFGVGAGDG